MRTFLLNLGLSSYEASKLIDVYGESAATISLFGSLTGRKELASVIDSSSVEVAHLKLCRIWNAKKLFALLEPFGVPAELIYRFYVQSDEDEEECLRKLSADPYRLVFDCFAPFPSVDAAAKGIGTVDPAKRIQAAVYSALLLAEHGTEDSGSDKISEAVQKVAGSTCLPIRKLIALAKKLLGDDTDAEDILDAARKLHFEKKILLTRKSFDGEQTLVAFRSELAECEFGAAEIIRSLLTSGEIRYAQSPYKAIDAAQQSLGLYLSFEQVNAVKQALTSRISVITGGPGTGKTQTQKVLLEAYRRLSGGGSVLLMAPTGQAAKRMETATGYPASTIHSALGIYPGETDPRRANDLTAGLIVIDEASMVDAQLFYMLLKHIGNAALVIAGDVDQLPSIGAGDILAELIKCVPVSRLTKIFRQDGDAADIAYNAARIKVGSPKMIESERFSFIEAESSQDIQKAVCEVYSKEAAEAGIENVAVLTPLRRKTKTGVNQLNKELRKTCSDATRYVTHGDMRIYLNDKVVFLKNRYGLNNGTKGFVEKVGKDSVECVFPGKNIVLSGSQLSWIVPAYAETIHKSQGDEFKVVIVVADKAHCPTKAMTYTAVTRSKDKLIVVGSRTAFMESCQRLPERRYTLLSSLVKN